jgi:hypothetical protein
MPRTDRIDHRGLRQAHDSNWDSSKQLSLFSGEQVAVRGFVDNGTAKSRYGVDSVTDTQDWRTIAPEVTAIITSIITESGQFGVDQLLAGLSEALVSSQTAWILDIETPASLAATNFADGPFPSRAVVPSRAEYQGEVIIWISGGRVSGIEYVWVTDTVPTRWPRPDEMEIVRSW